jgi:phage/plasmid primase-like uncharacterized protein
MTSRTEWQRVRRDHPCPICGRPDWCLVARDGTAAICARIESPKRCGEAGWLHRLRDDPLRPTGRLVRSIALPTAGPRHDLARLADEFARAVDQTFLVSFASSLGLTADSLRRLRVGWADDQRAWAFPMTNPSGVVLGIRMRGPDGRKFAVKGGKEGLFLPQGIEARPRTVLVCEGPTDAAALLDMGFLNVAGRPNCTGGVKLLVDLIRLRRPDEVVIVADGDAPGQRGAGNLASVLVAHAPAVRVIQPPTGIKDARDWLRAGATHQDVRAAIDATPARRLVVRAVPVGRRK